MTGRSRSSVRRFIEFALQHGLEAGTREPTGEQLARLANPSFQVDIDMHSYREKLSPHPALLVQLGAGDG